MQTAHAIAIATIDNVSLAAVHSEPVSQWMFIGNVWSRHRGKFLQVQVTVEDEGVFTTPFGATLTYVPKAIGFDLVFIA